MRLIIEKIKKHKYEVFSEWLRDIKHNRKYKYEKVTLYRCKICGRIKFKKKKIKKKEDVEQKLLERYEEIEECRKELNKRWGTNL